MKKKTKNLILSIVVTLILLLTFTVTYAVFTYQQTGEDNQQLVLGDIYMHYTETNELKLENAMPGDAYSEYFEFRVSGKNTYTKQDIYYEITLSKGDLIEDKTESNRIPDEYLKFRLVEVNDDNSETIIINDKTYSNLTNKRIWVETISKNTTNEYTKTYRLYMVINDNLIIGNTTDAMYTSDEWKDVFASIKVGVFGDFQEKVLTYEDIYNVTPSSCFTTEELGTTYIHNTNMTEEELNACVIYFTTNDNYGSGFIEYLTGNGESLETFCNGTGTADGGTFQEWLDTESFEEELIYFEENNIIINNGESVKITDYDATCGSDVVIPKNIGDYSVTTIDSRSFYNSNLMSIIIPDSVTTIGEQAFSLNKLSSVVVPSSVKNIGSYAFSNSFGYGGLSYLTSVTIKGKTSLEDFEYLGSSVFGWAEGYTDENIKFDN